MSPSATAALEDGLARLADGRLVRPALALYGVHLLVSIGSQSQLELQREELANDPLFEEAVIPETLPLALEVPLGVATLCWLAGIVAFITASTVAFRVLVSREAGAGPEAIPPSAGGTAGDSRLDGGSLLAATGHGLGVAIVGGLAVSLGLVAFVLPGLFVATVLAFTHPYIAVDGDGALEAMRKSVEATRGHRLQVFAVLAVAVGSYVAVSFAGAVALVLLESAPLVGELVNVAVGTVAWLVVLAILASAFDAVEAARAEREERFAGIDDELLP